MNFWTTNANKLRAFFGNYAPKLRQLRHIESPVLQREVDVDVYLPHDYYSRKDSVFPIVFFNDGQDLLRAEYEATLKKLWKKHQIPSFISIGIHAGRDRMREYGTAMQRDYKGRGDLAGTYKTFVLQELLPFLREKFRISDSKEDTIYAGFSLGGLSAFDIAWANPEIFGKIGVFSGALWWRWSPVNPDSPDADRILHHIVAFTPDRPNEQQFWLQVGTKDEEDDRNNNGVIDAIDDTLDLIRELKKRGYSDSVIRYLEIPDGTHDPLTWGKAMPDFLKWALVNGERNES